jgi:hypothetical protein
VNRNHQDTKAQGEHKGGPSGPPFVPFVPLW